MHILIIIIIIKSFQHVGAVTLLSDLVSERIFRSLGDRLIASNNERVGHCFKQLWG